MQSKIHRHEKQFEQINRRRSYKLMWKIQWVKRKRNKNQNSDSSEQSKQICVILFRVV